MSAVADGALRFLLTMFAIGVVVFVAYLIYDWRETGRERKEKTARGEP